MTNKKYTLYKHTTPSGKVYIGITRQDVEKRWGGGHGYRYHPYFWNAIQKYGWGNIKHEILLDGLSESEACEKEKEYILKYQSNNSTFGYNLTTGGESGYTISSESIEKISARAKRQAVEERELRSARQKEWNAKRTPEEKKALMEKAVRTRRERYSAEERAEQYRRAVESAKKTNAAKGGKSPEERSAISERMKKYWERYHEAHPRKKKKYRPPRVYVTLTPEERTRRNREAMLARWEDPEYREKMEKLNIGRHFTLSEETKAKMRKPKSEETKMKMRKPKSDETRKKMSEAKRKYFASMTPEQKERFSQHCRNAMIKRNNKKI